jgi:hypothetical protein
VSARAFLRTVYADVVGGGGLRDNSAHGCFYFIPRDLEFKSITLEGLKLSPAREEAVKIAVKYTNEISGTCTDLYVFR